MNDTLARITHLAVTTSMVVAALIVAPTASDIGREASVEAQGRSGLCAARAGGLPLINSSEWTPDDDSSSASCVYADDTPTHRSISAEVVWHDVAAVGADAAEMDARFCETGEAGDRARQFTQFDNNGIDAARIGTRRVYATYNFIPAGRRGAARRLAARLIDAVEDGASACPGAVVGGTEDGPTGVEIVLSGPRLQALREAGGVGTIIGLEGDESYGLVLTDSDGVDVGVDDFIGRRGRVVEIGVSLLGEDGVEVVSVTVEIIDDAPLGSPPPDTATDDGQPEPEEPRDVGDDTSTGDLVTPPPDSAPEVTPRPSTTVEPLVADSASDGGDRIDALIDRLADQIESIEATGSGVVIVDADDIGAVAARAGAVIASVRLRPGKLEVAARSTKYPKIFLYPELDRASGTVDVKIKVEPPGDFGFVEIPIHPGLLAAAIPDAAGQLERALDAVNAEVRRRGLRPTSIFLDENGLVMEVKSAR